MWNLMVMPIYNKIQEKQKLGLNHNAPEATEIIRDFVYDMTKSQIQFINDVMQSAQNFIP